MNVLLWADYTRSWLRTQLQSRLNITSDRGATAVEYGIMVALIAAVIVVIVSVLGKQVYNAFCTVAKELPAITGSACTLK